ncbi:CELSR3 [Mytilus edulis]|uniref:CELSR3 n=1 Tax=Mytilus edulis TaxID=6550 RepID=A0A8S3QXB4_MYTED|nr:CELSR3 [Mytilus edulis]
MICFSISYKKFLLLSIISTVSSSHTSKEEYISAAQSDILNTTRKSNFESTAEQSDILNNTRKSNLESTAEQSDILNTTRKSNFESTAEQSDILNNTRKSNLQSTAEQSDILNTTRKSNFESTAEQSNILNTTQESNLESTAEQSDILNTTQKSNLESTAEQSDILNTTQEPNLESTAELYSVASEIEKNQQKYECLSGTSDATVNAGYFVSVSCPTDYGNQTVIDRCSRVSLVKDGTFVVSNESHIFRNEYCAYCNDVTNFTSFDLQLYNLRINVDEYRKVSSELTGQEKLNYTLQLSDYLQMIPPGTVTRFCMTGLQDRKNFACQLYVNPVIAVDTNHITRLYRNIFCVIPSDVKHIRCLPRILDIPSVGVFTIHKLSVLFSFKTVIEKSDNIDCGVWSQEVSICMDRLLTRGTCAHLETYQNKVIDVEYFLTSSTNLSVTGWSRISLMSVWAYAISNISSLIAMENIHVMTNNDHVTSHVQFKLKIIKRAFYQEMKNIETDLQNQNIRLIITDNATQETVEVKTMQKDETGYQNVSHMYDNAKTYSIDNEVFLNYYLPELNVFIMVGPIDKLCGHLVIKVTRLGNLLRVDNYECLHHITRVVTTFSIMSIVTYIAFSLSVVALIGLIVFNRKHNLITNIPGSNLENISVSLLLSNVLFMFGIGVPNVYNLCYVIGVLLQYLWLSVFSFMTISISFIAKNLVQMRTREIIGHNKVFYGRRMLTFIGLAVPLMIVGPSVFVDQFGPEYLSLGYDGQVCFPNRYPGNIIFFTGPVIVSVIWNFLCLYLTIFQICRVRYQVGNIRKSVPFQDAMVYLRIVVLSGMLWGFGIASAVFESELLEYIFIILCGLQGFCIAIANLTTSKVICCRKTNESSENITVTNLSTFSG